MGFLSCAVFRLSAAVVASESSSIELAQTRFHTSKVRRTLAPKLTNSGILYPTRSNSPFLTRTVALVHGLLGFWFGLAKNLAKALI